MPAPLSLTDSGESDALGLPTERVRREPPCEGVNEFLCWASQNTSFLPATGLARHTPVDLSWQGGTHPREEGRETGEEWEDRLLFCSAF